MPPLFRHPDPPIHLLSDGVTRRGCGSHKKRWGRSACTIRALESAVCLVMEQLEERRLLSAAQVVGRDVFYNNSYFDGRNPAADTSDDNAIATDKQALLPGQTASFTNYTSYSKGINGVMVDIAGLGSPLNLTAADF